MKTCNTCFKVNKSKSLNECRNCTLIRWHKEDPVVFLKRVWNNIKIRCTNKYHSTAKYYYGKKYCDRDEFINYFKNNKTFLKLFKRWAKFDYEYKEIPSINRKNNDLGYLLENLEFITHSENCGINKEKLPILMYDLEGNFIKEYPSKWAAHKELNIPNGNICKVVYGKRKSAGGYVFKFKS